MKALLGIVGLLLVLGLTSLLVKKQLPADSAQGALPTPAQGQQVQQQVRQQLDAALQLQQQTRAAPDEK